MMLFKATAIILTIALIYHLLTKEYVQWEKFYFIFGKKGSGKSTTLTKIAMNYIKKGYKVYASYDMPGCETFNPRDIGHWKFDDWSIVIVDEMSLLYSNRDFKNMDPKVIEWVQQLRKQHCRLYGASVCFDIDLKLRDQADYLYLMKKYLRVLSVCRLIDKSPELIKANQFTEARITDQLGFVFPLLPGAFIVSWIPRWAKFYNTWENTLDLPSINERTKHNEPTEKMKKWWIYRKETLRKVKRKKKGRGNVHGKLKEIQVLDDPGISGQLETES